MKFARFDIPPIVVLVLVVGGAVVAYQSAFHPAQSNILYVGGTLNVLGQSTVTISVGSGKGQICADDLTSGLKQCTSTSYMFPVKENDTVTFNGIPDSGFVFENFVTVIGNEITLNPWTVRIVTRSDLPAPTVTANFTASQSSSMTGTSTITSTSAGGGTTYTSTSTRTSSAGATASTSSQGTSQQATSWLTGTTWGTPNWLLIVIAILLLIALIRLVSR